MMFEVLYNSIKKNDSDISMCKFKYYFDMEPEFIYNDVDKNYSNIEAMRELILNRKITSHLWNKLYKKELFNDIKFPIGKIYEDIGTIYKIFHKAKKITMNNSILYAYLQRKKSLSNSITEKKIKDYIEMIDERYVFLIKNYTELSSDICASRVQSSMIFNYIIAKDNNINLYNSDIILDDYRRNIKLKFNFMFRIKIKYLFSILLLKISRRLFYKVFSS